MNDLADWLELAPQPAPLETGRKWHVFLSYRSSERAWVLSLVRHPDAAGLLGLHGPVRPELRGSLGALARGEPGGQPSRCPCLVDPQRKLGVVQAGVRQLPDASGRARSSGSSSPGCLGRRCRFSRATPSGRTSRSSAMGPAARRCCGCCTVSTGSPFQRALSGLRRISTGRPKRSLALLKAHTDAHDGGGHRAARAVQRLGLAGRSAVALRRRRGIDFHARP